VADTAAVAAAVAAPPRTRAGARLSIAGAAVLVVAATVAYWAIALRGIESTNDAFVDGHLVFLSARVGGQVAQVLVEENQHVHAGDALVRLDPADFETHVARARADLDAAKNRMVETRSGADAAAARVRAVEARLRHAEQELVRDRELAVGGAGSRSALDAAQADRDSMAAELHAAEEQERAERAALGNEAPVKQAEAMLREAELALTHAVVTAPFDGVVGKRNVEVGANVSLGQALLALAEDAPSWVVANFKETQIERMHAGDAATVYVDAFPGEVLHGHIESLAPATGAKYALLPPDNASGNFTKVVQRVPVRIAFDPISGQSTFPLVADRRPWLPVGLSVDVRVRIR
jgi:membrane fusion protein (multidrug efflux system)